jgi:predicted DNA-binding protein (MmcQ/YjbR family)
VTGSAAEDQRLRRMRKICASLPEATCERSGRHAVFRVRGRTFAYYLDDHRGDEGIVGAVFKLEAQEEAEALLAADPDGLYRPAYVGPKGWLGVRLDKARVDWHELAGFLEESYVRVAPKSLARRLRARV